MCKFFSLCSNGKGTLYYLDANDRKAVKGTDINPDSHASITEYYKKKGVLALKADTEDRLNKYEYNPITGVFTVDQLNTADDSAVVEKKCGELDFSTIVPELIIKSVIHPFRDRHRKRVTKKDVELLKQWAEVRDSVRKAVWGSVTDSVWGSVCYSVCYSVWDSVWCAARDVVWDSVWYSVGYSVHKSVYYSVHKSVRDSTYAYISSFFKLDEWKHINHEPGKNPYQPCIDLWEKGLVPSFDGKVWRLHGERGKVLKEIREENL